MPRHDASELAIRLGREAEAVCRHYLDAGHRQGNYWQVGDARNTPGRSMFVRLSGPARGPGAAGRWRDAATGRALLQLGKDVCPDAADDLDSLRRAVRPMLLQLLGGRGLMVWQLAAAGRTPAR